MSHTEPTPAERRFLTEAPRTLARIATVDSRGMPHVVPTGWTWDDVAGELVLGGRDVTRTLRARHVRRSGVAAVVVDGVDTSHGWAPWALTVSGRARVDEDAGTIRVTPEHISSWGLENVPSVSGTTAPS